MNESSLSKMKRDLSKTNKVVNEIETILQLAKNGRKRLKAEEIERCGNIDSDKLWKLIQDWSTARKIPIDVLKLRTDSS